uniref:Uncharacterized protein n=1 Tax=Rhizophora mucronata TaxID=61149 RepID=A0A2P2IXF3_RHIMU
MNCTSLHWHPSIANPRVITINAVTATPVFMLIGHNKYNTS